MQLGIFAKTFEGKDPLTVLSAAKAAGYSAVQYNMACSGLPSMPDEIPESTAKAVKSVSEATGVDIVAVSGTYNMIHPDPRVREQGHARLKVIARNAHAMGTRLITLCTGTRDPDDQWHAHSANTSTEAWRDLLKSFEAALMIAEEFDVDLGIEPEHANVVSSAVRARHLISELRSPRIKIVLDAANLIEDQVGPAQHVVVIRAVDLLGEYIALAHAKDRTRSGGFATAGEGILDYDHFLACLKRVEFNGPLITHGLSAAEAPGVAAFLKERLEVVP